LRAKAKFTFAEILFHVVGVALDAKQTPEFVAMRIATVACTKNSARSGVNLQRGKKAFVTNVIHSLQNHKNNHVSKKNKIKEISDTK
jgi:hypothetical protein